MCTAVVIFHLLLSMGVVFFLISCRKQLVVVVFHYSCLSSLFFSFFLHSFISITSVVPLKFSLKFPIPICPRTFVANRRNKSILWRVVTEISFHRKRTTYKYFLSKFRWFPVSLLLQYLFHCNVY